MFRKGEFEDFKRNRKYLVDVSIVKIQIYHHILNLWQIYELVI